MSPFYTGHYSEMDYARELERLPLQIPANATGTTDAENIFLAGERGPELVVGARGSTVFPTGETQRIIDAVSEYEKDAPYYSEIGLSKLETQSMISAPQFALYQNRNIDAVYAQSGDRDAPQIKLTVAPVYHIEGTGNPAEIERVLRERTEDMREMVLDIIDDAEIDKARRAYA